MNGWQPIATAPKDGTPFLAFGPNSIARLPIMAVMEWHRDDVFVMSHVSGWEYDEDLQEPTHWQPLPAPPEAT